MILWKFTLRELKNRPGRATLTLMSIVIGVAAIVSVNVTTTTTHSGYEELYRSFTGRVALEVVKESEGTTYPATLAELTSLLDGQSDLRWNALHTDDAALRAFDLAQLAAQAGQLPRELELMYPAAHYDTPVTGYWDKEERAWVGGCLRSYLEKNKYNNIIAHVHGAYREICEEVAGGLGLDLVYTADNGVTSRESLGKLEQAVSTSENGKKRSGDEAKLDLMRAAAKQRNTLAALIVHGDVVNTGALRASAFLGGCRQLVAECEPRMITLGAT